MTSSRPSTHGSRTRRQQPRHTGTYRGGTRRASTTFIFLFNGKINFNGEIGGWDTSKVTNMEGTFNRAYAFNKPLDWDTSKVTT